jgi:hypothetical protein
MLAFKNSVRYTTHWHTKEGAMTPDKAERVYYDWMYRRAHTSGRAAQQLVSDQDWDLLTPEQRREYHEKYEGAMDVLTRIKVMEYADTQRREL